MTLMMIAIRPRSRAAARRVLISLSRACEESRSRLLSTAAQERGSPPPPPSEAEDLAPRFLYMWGTDTKGSLLKPPSMETQKVLDTPQRIDISSFDPSGVPLQSVICGATDTAFLFQNGDCYVCGENKQGQLGVGHTKPVGEPLRMNEFLPYADDQQIRSVSLGPNFSAFTTTQGELYTCGFGGSTFSGMGALGHGNSDHYHQPKLVESLVEDGCYVDQVQVGESHMTVLTTEGEVLCCGAGSYGRLGNFDTIDQLYLEPVELLHSGITQIAGGKSFTMALNEQGVLYGWGRNHKGQLGTGLGLAVDMYAMQAVPEPIVADELVGRNVVKVAAGHSHVAAITSGGELFQWGMALHLEPVRVHELLQTKIVDVACGQDSTFAMDENGNLYSFGKGKDGVLGQGHKKNMNQATLMEAFQGTSTPTLVLDEEDKQEQEASNNKKLKIVQMSAGWKHAACLVEEVEK